MILSDLSMLRKLPSNADITTKKPREAVGERTVNSSAILMEIYRNDPARTWRRNYFVATARYV
jgi:hypothetical protein